MSDSLRRSACEFCECLPCFMWLDGGRRFLYGTGFATLVFRCCLSCHLMALRWVKKLFVAIIVGAMASAMAVYIHWDQTARDNTKIDGKHVPNRDWWCLVPLDLSYAAPAVCAGSAKEAYQLLSIDGPTTRAASQSNTATTNNPFSTNHNNQQSKVITQNNRQSSQKSATTSHAKGPRYQQRYMHTGLHQSNQPYGRLRLRRFVRGQHAR